MLSLGRLFGDLDSAKDGFESTVASAQGEKEAVHMGQIALDMPSVAQSVPLTDLRMPVVTRIGSSDSLTVEPLRIRTIFPASTVAAAGAARLVTRRSNVLPAHMLSKSDGSPDPPSGRGDSSARMQSPPSLWSFGSEASLAAAGGEGMRYLPTNSPPQPQRRVSLLRRHRSLLQARSRRSWQYSVTASDTMGLLSEEDGQDETIADMRGDDDACSSISSLSDEDTSSQQQQQQQQDCSYATQRILTDALDSASALTKALIQHELGGSVTKVSTMPTM